MYFSSDSVTQQVAYITYIAYIAYIAYTAYIVYIAYIAYIPNPCPNPTQNLPEPRPQRPQIDPKGLLEGIWILSGTNA